MNSISTRDEVPEEYKWDLSTIFASPDGWNQTRTETESLAADLRECDPTTAEEFAVLLFDFERLIRREQRLGLYVQLRCNENTEDTAREEQRTEYEELSKDITRAKTAVRRSIQTLPRERIEEFAERDDFAGFERYFNDTVRMGEHVRSPEVEDTLTTLNLDSPNRIFVSLVNRDFEPPTVDGPDGEPVRVTRNNRSRHLASSDRAFRRRVYEAFNEELTGLNHAIATAYAEKVKTQSNLAAIRNFDSARERTFNTERYPQTGLRIDFPTEAHDTMIETIQSNLGPYHRYHHLYRDNLDIEKLRPWDMNVPLTDGDRPKIPYDNVRDHLLAAVEPLGSEYQDRLATLLDENRIDVYETKEKRSDIVAYCPSSYDTGAYILANYDDDIRSLFILAHELGHAINVSYLRDARRPLYATTPRPVEEVPSLLHELLLAQHFLDTDQYRGHVFDRLLGTVGGNFYGTAIWSAFTHETYRAVEAGETLTADRLDDIYGELYEKFRSPVVPSDYSNSGWLAGSHARQPYHHYQYVLGVVGATVIFDRLTEGTLSPEAYHDFLRTGGRQPAVETFVDIGIDVRSPEPYERAVSMFADYVDESPWA